MPTSPSVYLELSRELRQAVDKALDAYSQFGADCPEVLSQAIRHSLLAPGKRLRPILVLMAAACCGCENERAMPAACAVEMIHTYSLVHDDLPAMDDDDLRRGLPTCHTVYGEAMAILAGDALLARAFEILARDVEPPQVAARCCAELAEAAGATQLVGGQADDLTSESYAASLTRLEAIHRRKTGAMFRVSLRLGGLVGNATSAQIEALDSYGRNLGLAFQIVDDLLDRSGNVQSLGKRTGKDEGRGKLTFPTLLGLDASRERARQLIDEACLAIQIFSDNASGLEALARFVLERNQ